MDGLKAYPFSPILARASVGLRPSFSSGLRLPNDGIFAGGTEAGRGRNREWTGQVSGEIGARSGSDRHRPRPDSGMRFPDFGQAPRARDGTAEPATAEPQPVGRTRRGTITNVRSASFAGGGERAVSRATTRCC